MPPVYIIIVNYKRWQDTVECLDSVFRSSYKNYSVIVVDNNSQNDSLEHLMKWVDNNAARYSGHPDYVFVHKTEINDLISKSPFPRLTFIQNDINAGFAAGNNVVLKFLSDRNAYFLLLNPDMVIKKDTLEELVRFTVRQPPHAIVGAQTRAFAGNQELLFYGGGKLNYISGTVKMAKKASLIPKIDYISGGCLFSHTSNLKRAGLLPEMYFLYWEDSDWCCRARALGSSILVCSTAICYDKISTVIGKGFLADYYYVRNSLLFIWKYRKKNLPFVLFFNGIRFFKRLITGQGKRAMGVLRGTMDFFKLKRNDTK